MKKKESAKELVLSHTDNSGKASMVDISNKPDQERIAVASGKIYLSPDTIKAIKLNQVKKGDVIAISEFAGIQAAKKTSDLIPLCHNIPISKIDVNIKLHKNYAESTATAKTVAKTGIEMEALTAVSISLLTLYDMCKAIDKEMYIYDIKLISKTKK